MSKFLDSSGLSYLWSKLEDKFTTKQNVLVSGTSIKTINNTSVLGSGNISIPKGDKGDPLTYADLTAALKLEIAQPATEQATIAAEHLATIQDALVNLDPSQSTEDAIVALTALVADTKASIDDLGIGMLSDGLGDLDISDELGYVLGRFENGHVRTKNFYSGDACTGLNITTDALSDLDISDEDGNILGRFENGHIKTKNFYSGDVYTKEEINTLFLGGLGTSPSDGVTQALLTSALATKQDKLTSGTNIKTINGNSILGQGNIVISGGGNSTENQLHLKILILGNSYSYDSFMYSPFILKNYGITIEMGIYYRASGSITNHVSEWNSTGYTLCHIDTSLDETSWTVNSGYGPKKSVEYTDWDIIVLLQGSSASTSLPYSNTRTLINNILDAYLAKFGKSVQLGWNINHNRLASGDSATVSANILNNIKTVVDTQPISIIFPYGTAIFDARTNSTLDAIGAGRHLWASDNVHLLEGLACYLANVANIQALFNKFYPKYSVIGETLGPTITSSMIDGWNVQNQNGTCSGISEANCRLALICAIVANRYNFEIKTIS